MPPAVALLNYMSYGIPWRIFSQTGIFAGFFNIIKVEQWKDIRSPPGSPSLGLKKSFFVSGNFAGFSFLCILKILSEGSAKLPWAERGPVVFQDAV